MRSSVPGCLWPTRKATLSNTEKYCMKHTWFIRFSFINKIFTSKIQDVTGAANSHMLGNEKEALPRRLYPQKNGLIRILADKAVFLGN